MNTASHIETHGGPGKFKTVYCALIGCWLLPARSARDLSHISLAVAYCVHLTAAVLSAAAFVTVSVANIALSDDDPNVWFHVLSLLNEILADFSEAPTFMIFMTVFFVAAVEASFVGVALTLLPFAARHERARDSIRHSLRRVWLHTNHIPIAILVVGVFGTTITVTHHRWHQARWQEKMHELYPHLTQPSPDASDAQRVAYAKATQEVYHQLEQDDAKHSTPWYIRWTYELVAYSVFLASLWLLWSLYRGAASPRSFTVPLESPLCRLCGYNASGLPPDKNCPECGRPLLESLDATTSPGAAWEHRERYGPVSRFFRTRNIWRRRPTVAAQQLRLTPHRTSCLRYVAIHLISCGILVMLGLCLALYLDNESLSPHQLFVVTIVFPIFSLQATLILLCLVSIAALLPGITWLLKDRRNVLAGTAQIACYCSGDFVPWVLLNVMLIMAAVVSDNAIRVLSKNWNVDLEFILAAAFVTLNLFITIAYLVRVYRASAGVRYAIR